MQNTSINTANHLNNSSSDDTYITFQGGVTATLRSWSALKTAVEQSWGGTESQTKAEDLRNNTFNFLDGKSSKPKMTQEELGDNLASYMEEEFGIVLEDGSEIEISNLIWNMYEDCSKGDVRRLAVSVVQDAIRAEESMKTGNVKMMKNVIQSGEDDDDDDDDEHMIDDDNNIEQQQSTALVGSSSVSSNHPPQQQQSALQIGMVNTTTNNNNSIENVAKSYYLLSSTLFGSPPKPKKELPPPRQLGEKPEEKPQPQVDDDGFAVVKKKGR